MAAAPAALRGDDALSALARGGVLCDVRPGAVVLVAGAGEDDLVQALAARGALIHGPGGSAAAAAGGTRPALVVAGEGGPRAIGEALERAHDAGCPFAYCRREASLPEVRRWYWCHQVPIEDARLPTLGETLRGPDGGSAPVGATRYGHWVGWRRILPADHGSPGSLAAPPPAP